MNVPNWHTLSGEREQSTPMIKYNLCTQYKILPSGRLLRKVSSDGQKSNSRSSLDIGYEQPDVRLSAFDSQVQQKTLSSPGGVSTTTSLTLPKKSDVVLDCDYPVKNLDSLICDDAGQPPRKRKRKLSQDIGSTPRKRTQRIRLDRKQLRGVANKDDFYMKINEHSSSISCENNSPVPQENAEIFVKSEKDKEQDVVGKKETMNKNKQIKQEQNDQVLNGSSSSKSITTLAEKSEKEGKRTRRKKGPNSPYHTGSSRYYGVCRVYRGRNNIRKK